MNTQLPILNVASLQNSARPATQADSFSADVPFNQVLNKEVSNRNTENQSKPNTATQDNAAADAAKPATPTPPASTAASSDSSTKTASTDEKSDEDKAAADDQSTTDAASAQMLALVANLGQIAVQPTARKPGDADMDALANQKGGKKSIAVINAKDQKDLADLQKQDDGKGKALDISSMSDNKDVADSKDKPVFQARSAADKAQPESPVSTKAVQADLQDAANATRAAAKAAPEVVVKPADTAQPTAATVIPALQQSLTVSQQAALAGQAVDRLAPTVGGKGWDQAVGQKVLWMATNGTQSASLTLNPPDLGPLQVVLHVTNQHADATFITAQPEVKQALENAMPKLREMMDQAGIQLGQATVNTGNPNQQQGANQQQARGSNSSHFGAGTDDADVNVAIVPRPVATGGQGLVDTFA
ncbi:flagellar hook-length control protein FliK [Herbaspirillum rhizosphaerae]|uniref:flagellar hook-length control protein FliK n=1 Tax=Herbaspirillum rhizosphaerae TaxID=346179 RepID=UPI00067AD4A3|nr:flagellar hook-length control protein FliK [Herbaspirillum rhizosphaerae]